MRGETAYGCARYPAPQFNRSDDFLQARDGCARKRFAIELEVEAAIFLVHHLNRRGILPHTAEQELADAISRRRIRGMAVTHYERAGAVPEESAELSCHAAGSQRPAVHIRSDNGDSLRPTRTDQ